MKAIEDDIMLASRHKLENGKSASRTFAANFGERLGCFGEGD